ASKTESMTLCAASGIPTPDFRVCENAGEMETAFAGIGFPLVIKLDRSGGGEGVFICRSRGQGRLHEERLRHQKFVIEKFIDGDGINVEPLFIGGRLAGYACSETCIAYNDTGVTLRRQYMPCPDIQETLETLGRKLDLTGFCNIGFMRENGSGRHYL